METQQKSVQILVIDDEIRIRESICFYFRRKGYITFDADSGNQALNIIRAQNIDIVVTDVKMENGDGISFLENLRRINLITPYVIVTTGYSDFDSDEIIKKGANAFIKKPYTLPYLLEIIDRLLNKK